MIKLNPHLTLSIEKQDKKARLVVYDGETELVCRKSSFAELKKIIQTDDIHLFKGRLQLLRNAEIITVVVKGKTAGVVSMEDFCEQYHLVMAKSVN